MKFYFSIIDERRGTVLLLALLVMAGVVAAGAGVGTLVISELRQSRQLDQAIVAYYLAESGIEDALFQMRKENVSGSDLNNTEQTINEGKWQRTAINPLQVSATLAEEDVLEIRTNGQPRTFKVEWSKEKDTDQAQLHIVRVLQLEEGQKVEQALVTDYSFDYSVDATVQLVRLRAIFGPIAKIIVSADGGVPGWWEITSVGQYRESRQAVTVTVPEKEPAYSLFDYAIFSGSDLSK